MNTREGEFELDPEKNEFVLNCCDWQAITEIVDEAPILVTVFFRVYQILDIKIRFKQLYDATQKNMYKKIKFKARFVGVSIPCPKCYGKRKLDWVEKIMTKRSYPPPITRDPYARVLKFKIPVKYNPHIPSKDMDYMNPFFTDNFLHRIQKDITHQYIYTSYPNIETHEEYCPKCYGSGLRELSNSGVVLVKSMKGAKLL